MVICYTVVVTKINHLCYTLMYHVFVPLSQKSISIRKYFIDSEKKRDAKCGPIAIQLLHYLINDMKVLTRCCLLYTSILYI